MHNPRGSTGYGSTISSSLVGRIGQVKLRDLMSGVDAMIERGIADPERLGLGGWSWGSHMTAWTVTQTDRFKAAVMGAGLPETWSTAAQHQRHPVSEPLCLPSRCSRILSHSGNGRRSSFIRNCTNASDDPPRRGR
ncbi:MAG: prolyl oligopeptidase family serine peptidase [Thermomicrobiales bacterium]